MTSSCEASFRKAFTMSASQSVVRSRRFVGLSVASLYVYSGWLTRTWLKTSVAEYAGTVCGREAWMTRIALMGFGRIGRNLFRILYKRDDVRIVAISDVADHKALEYLLRFDTLLGPFPDEVAIKEGNLYVWGRQIRMLNGEE